MRIIFIRHGEPDYRNDCLTETGREQALLAAERIQGEGIEEIWSSPLGRAYETAEAASKLLGIPIQMVVLSLETSLSIYIFKWARISA